MHRQRPRPPSPLPPHAASVRIDLRSAAQAAAVATSLAVDDPQLHTVSTEGCRVVAAVQGTTLATLRSTLDDLLRCAEVAVAAAAHAPTSPHGDEDGGGSRAPSAVRHRGPT